MTIENTIGGQEGAAHEILMFPWCYVAAPSQPGTLDAQDWSKLTVLFPEAPWLTALGGGGSEFLL